LPGKNIKLLCGKPLIAWTIDHAKKSKYLDDILVSTDCEKIADISKKYDANVSFLRPEELATDDAKAIDVIIHAIDYLEGQGCLYDLVMYLQPTSPLREPEDIDCAIESLFSSNAQVVVGVCEAEYPSYAMNILPPDGCMKHFLKPELINKNRQDLPIEYRINGAIYLVYSNYLKLQRSLFGEETYAYIIPRERSVDIDNEIDFKFAEFILNSR
jgi:N-acylneuraminate cytidylyltransferase/CMP-N,N'-diacetyllegionaminic acid synthase